MENNEPIRNPEYDKLPESANVHFLTPAEIIAIGPPPSDHDAGIDKVINNLRVFMTRQQFKNELLEHKSACYKRLLESKEVTLTEEGKRQKGIIDRL
jgi:hypothetical protein